MSVQHLAWALEQRTGSVSRKVVLLALANRVNSDTGLCCPSIATIMQETELGRATVFRSLESLEEQGLIQRVERARENGSRTSSEYRFPRVKVVRGGSQSETGDGATVRPPEPEVRTKEQNLAAAPRMPSRKEQRKNDTWDALTAIFGEPETRTAQQVRGKVCRSLIEARASPEEIIARAKRWPLHFDEATLTDLALEKHWTTLSKPPLRRAR